MYNAFTVTTIVLAIEIDLFPQIENDTEIQNSCIQDFVSHSRNWIQSFGSCNWFIAEPNNEIVPRTNTLKGKGKV